ncbi:hypothetical protein EEL35_13015 [Muribaculaceae bacterium Isolate-042 (Harlan)]|nr:hypothetical protein EEL35_13015 [Muribaculaceae bacterium Isolate-042 (Harlan)]
MKIKPRTIKHEKFKEMVKEWLDTHREEYCAFAEEVSRRDRSGFIQIFEYAQLAAPGYANVVMAKMSEKNPKDLVEKAREFDPLGHAGFDPSGIIRLTP